MKSFRNIVFYSILLYSFTLYFNFVNASTLEDVQEREELNCGVRGGSAGFARLDDDGFWSGIDADYCKAVAAAVLKDANSVNYRILGSSVRFTALQNEEIDVLIRNTTWTYSRDTDLGIDFVGVNFYDGQGFIAWKKPGKISLNDYPSGTKICVEKNTSTITNMKDYIKNNNLSYELLEFVSASTAEDSFFAKRCEILTADASILASLMSENAVNTKAYMLLDDRISKEPLGPSVRDNDNQWREIVQWTLFSTIEAEEKGITSKNVDTLKKNSTDPAIRFMLGVTPGIGEKVGLDDEWVYRVIKQVGNYGEVFERNMGVKSKLGMKRGLNDLWTRGGLMYSPPMR